MPNSQTPATRIEEAMYKNQKIITDGITVEVFLDLLTERIQQEIQRAREAESNPNPQELLTRKEVFKLLHITFNTLHGWIKQGKIKAHNAGDINYEI